MPVTTPVLIGSNVSGRVPATPITQATWKKVTAAIAIETVVLSHAGVDENTADACQYATLIAFDALIKLEKEWNKKYGTDYH